MADEIHFNFKFFVKEIDYGLLGRGNGQSISVGIKLLDFPAIFIKPEITDNYRNIRQKENYSKGKSCRFLMTRGNLVKLLQTLPHSIRVHLVGSHDLSCDNILATGVLNDSTTWCSKLCFIMPELTAPLEVINKSYLIHFGGPNYGHVILRIKISLSTRRSIEIDREKLQRTDIATGQYLNDIEEQQIDNNSITYLANTWFPPPLLFTAQSISGQSTPLSVSEGSLPNNERDIRSLSPHWDAIVSKDINSWPWNGFKPNFPCVHTARCTSNGGGVSFQKEDHSDSPFPILSALCNEVKLLEQCLKGEREKVDKEVQTVIESTEKEEVIRGKETKRDHQMQLYKGCTCVCKEPAVTKQRKSTCITKADQLPAKSRNKMSVNKRFKKDLTSKKLSETKSSKDDKPQLHHAKVKEQPTSQELSQSSSQLASLHQSPPSSSHLPQSPKLLPSSSHLSQSPPLSHLSQSPPSPSHLSQSPLSPSRLSPPPPSHLSQSPPSHLSQSPPPPSHLSQSPSPPSHLSQSPTSPLHIPLIKTTRSGSSTPPKRYKTHYDHLLSHQSFGGSFESLEGTKSFLHPKILEQKVYLAASLQSLGQISNVSDHHVAVVKDTSKSKELQQQLSESSNNKDTAISDGEDISEYVSEELASYSEDFESDRDD